MKRCSSLLFFMALSLMFLSGCAEKTDWEPTEYGTVNNFDGVSMTVNELHYDGESFNCVVIINITINN